MVKSSRRGRHRPHLSHHRTSGSASGGSQRRETRKDIGAMNIKHVVIILVCIAFVSVALFIGLKYVKHSEKPLTRSEAQIECSYLLKTVAHHNHIDPKKFHLIEWRKYELAPRGTPTWEYYYKTPDKPNIIYCFFWMEELRKTDYSETNIADWNESDYGLQKP